MSCSGLGHDLLMTCSWLVLDLFMTYSSSCSWLVYNLTCLQLGHNLFMTCSWLVHGLFMTWSSLATAQLCSVQPGWRFIIQYIIDYWFTGVAYWKTTSMIKKEFINLVYNCYAQDKWKFMNKVGREMSSLTFWHSAIVLAVFYTIVFFLQECRNS